MEYHKETFHPVCFIRSIIFVLVLLFFLNSCQKQEKVLADFDCSIKSFTSSYQITEGRKIAIPLTITNDGKNAWISEGVQSYSLSYHLLDEQGNLINFENRRYPLPSKVFQNNKLKKTISIHAPLKKGNYQLEFDIVREGVFWFRDKGSSTLIINLQVLENNWNDIPENPTLEKGDFTFFSTGNNQINTLYKLIRLTLEENQIEFSNEGGTIKGFSAGSSYPQIWLRDANTIIPAAKYFYDADFITSWLEKHLELQDKNGSLADWFDSHFKTDKNTTETDQETSAIQAAYKTFQILGKDWLEKRINRLSVIERLDKALSFVLLERLDQETGLLKGAHTADWGDVDMIDKDETAVYVDARTHWTTDIYDQSMFYQACRELSEMLEVVNQKKRAHYWEKQAENIKLQTVKNLWMEEKGYFRIHNHLDLLNHSFKEDEIFALGGNALAITSKLADDRKASLIIREVLSRQKKSGLSTISATLYPPYPKDTFNHPLMNDLYEYQNGAQWDWFGGRMIRALFKTGFSQSAQNKLAEISRKNIKNNGFFEWDNKEGVGRGSDYFTGSAGVLGGLIIEEYFGLKLLRESLTIEPKLDTNQAYIHIHIPANGLFAAYKYKYEPDNKTIWFEINSNYPKDGLIKLLLPLIAGKNLRELSIRNITVNRDGNEIQFNLEKKKEDTLIVFKSDFKKRKYKISLN